MLMESTMVLNTVIANTAGATATQPAAALPTTEIETERRRMDGQSDLKTPNATKRSLAPKPTKTAGLAAVKAPDTLIAKTPARKPPVRGDAGGGPNKADLVLKKLRSAKGVTIALLMEVTGWQAHSVRGFLSGTVKKKRGLNLVSDIGKDGARRYRIHDDAKDA
jgi:hypothetical protein